MPDFNPYYEVISFVYGDLKAKRSQVPLINHIDEGLILLDAIGASQNAKDAYCLHPIYQGGMELLPELKTLTRLFSPEVCHLAIEYRRAANAYLSQHYVSDADEPELSQMPEVNEMLIADKVQNRKDFELYHKGTHPKSDVLDKYFKVWLRRLGISEERYQELSSKIILEEKK